ncbi:LemA family protein [Xenorhabdus taiwanensis]|uniref:LemA family protein n=1 Tax=Xenorhabdus taiwanensis TaxID=3085177 RepID=A0ABM8JQU1_9GAMM|nr:LemA family protein [Xenorhabdus sp. TCT-1]
MNDLIATFIIMILLILLLYYLIDNYNKVVVLKNYTEKAFANIDTLLKQRAAEIPELVNIVGKIMSHHKSLLLELTQSREYYLRCYQANQKVEVNNQITNILKQILLVSENYPELQALNNLNKLQKRITLLEEKIADRREFFNESVALYNTGIQTFPNLIFAKILGYKPRTMLHSNTINK